MLECLANILKDAFLRQLPGQTIDNNIKQYFKSFIPERGCIWAPHCSLVSIATIMRLLNELGWSVNIDAEMEPKYQPSVRSICTCRWQPRRRSRLTLPGPFLHGPCVYIVYKASWFIIYTHLIAIHLITIRFCPFKSHVKVINKFVNSWYIRRWLMFGIPSQSSNNI